MHKHRYAPSFSLTQPSLHSLRADREETSGLTVWDKSSPNVSLASFYKLHHKDPIFFNQGFKFVWRNGDITDPATGEKCINANGTPIGTPSAANVTTLVYAYLW